MSFSAHKLYGPKGVGALYIRQNGLTNFKMTSLIHGGQQESGYRAGTHGVHNIVGFGKACEIAKRDMHEYMKKIAQLEVEAKKIKGECDLHLSINTFTQLAFSYIDIKEAMILNNINKNEKNKEVIDLFEILFNKKENYINEYV